MENGGWVPSRIDTTNRKKVLQLVEKASRALGVTRGVTKGDVVICPRRGPMIIEMAARLSGGDFSESLIPFGSGINYVETAIEIAMGWQPSFDNLKPKKYRATANRYFFPPPGELEEITGIESCQKLKEVVKLEFYYNNGQAIPQMSNHSQRAGVFIVVGENREKVQKVVEQVYDTIKFKINGKFYSGDPVFYRNRECPTS
jgi:biotin carboxylase